MNEGDLTTQKERTMNLTAAQAQFDAATRAAASAERRLKKTGGTTAALDAAEDAQDRADAAFRDLQEALNREHLDAEAIASECALEDAENRYFDPDENGYEPGEGEVFDPDAGSDWRAIEGKDAAAQARHERAAGAY